jgi:hypothetical protein
MKLLLILFFLLPAFGFSQSHPEFQKQYVIEGVIVKGNNYEPVPFMVLKNTKLGISAISDEHGYYAVSFPLSYFKDTSIIQIDLEKTGEKPGKFWISYYPIDSTATSNIVWNANLQCIWISEKETDPVYQVGVHRRIKMDGHGYSGIQDAITEYISGRIRLDRTQQLMAGNQNVLFKLDNMYVLTMLNSIVWLDDEKLEIYLHGKRVRPRHINKLVKRDEVKEDGKRFREANKDPKIYKWFLKPVPKHTTRRRPTDTSSLPPEFKDNGKIIDSLKDVYSFETVEYNNWDYDNASDSSLTIYFINSKRLPAKDVEAAVKEFKAIASSIHRSIIDKNRYESYNIIFVTRTKNGNSTNSSYNAGPAFFAWEF